MKWFILVILLIILVLSLILCFIEWHNTKVRKDYLSENLNKSVIFFSRNHKLMFRVIDNNLEQNKEFYFYSAKKIWSENDSLIMEMSKVRIDVKEDLISYKHKYHTVKDILEYEEQQKKEIKEFNDNLIGNFEY